MRGLDEGHEDEDGPAYQSRRGAQQAEIALAVEEQHATLLAEDALCSGRYDAREIIFRYLKPSLPHLSLHDLSHEIVLSLCQEVSSRHHNELVAAEHDMTAEVLAGLPADVDAKALTLDELTRYAKSVQLRRHACANNNTARGLARRVKEQAKRKPPGLF